MTRRWVLSQLEVSVTNGMWIHWHCQNAENDEATRNCGKAPCELRFRHCEANAEQEVTGNHDYQARPETGPNPPPIGQKHVR